MATRPLEKPEESDTRVLGRYCESYTRPPRNSSLNDPQGLFSTAEREDVEHVLRTLNANSKFHLYVTVFKGGQDIPSELSGGSDTFLSPYFIYGPNLPFVQMMSIPLC